MPLYDYQCDLEHTTERYFSVEEKPFAIKCPKCRKEALQVILTCPAVHTLATFSADIDDGDVKQTRDPGDGSYFDPNLSRDRKTGKVTRITSRKQREELMKAKGLYELPPTDLAADTARLKKKKPVHFGAGGSRSTAHG